jgi:hypothetical protein
MIRIATPELRGATLATVARLHPQSCSYRKKQPFDGIRFINHPAIARVSRMADVRQRERGLIFDLSIFARVERAS